MNTACNTCTRLLVSEAYRRAGWFRLVRGPLAQGMLLWVRLARVDLSAYEFAAPICRGCVRFHKNALRDHSPLFRRLNDILNSLFDRALIRIVGAQAVEEAKDRSRHRDALPRAEEPQGWTRI